MKQTETNTNILSGRKALPVALIATALLFLAVILIGFPVYHSGDDLNIALILGDGYGTGASTCLPFLHNMHYWLSTPLVWLFKHFPDINWFSWSMILTEYASLTTIFYLLLRRLPVQRASILFVLLFAVYGSFLLQYLHNSSTAVTAIAAGLLLCWYHFMGGGSKKWLIPAAIFFILGTLFRLHVAFPMLVVAAPFFLLIPGWKRKWMSAGFIAGCILVSILCFVQQQKHYSAACPNWQTEENYRQAKYSNINNFRDSDKPSLQAYKMEISLIDNLILPDTSVVPLATLQLIGREASGIMPSYKFFTDETWFWPLQNNRLLILTAVLALLLPGLDKRWRLALFASLSASVAIMVYLMAFMKLPEFMIPSLLFVSCSFAAFGFISAYPVPLWKWNSVIITSCFLFAWASFRVMKTGDRNWNISEAFKNAHAEMVAHPDKLFISTGDNDCFFYVSVFATPKEFSFRNILFVDQPMSLRDAALLRDFGYTGFTEAVFNPNVYFRGHELPALTQYYEQQTQKKLNWGKRQKGYEYSGIYKPMPADVVSPGSK